MAGFYHNRGLSYFRMSLLTEALANLDQAVELAPDVGFFYANRGLAHCRRGNLQQAVADYSRAIELDCGSAEVLTGRGEAYARGGEYDEAMTDFDRALAIDPCCLAAYAYRIWVGRGCQVGRRRPKPRAAGGEERRK
jgi:tetratricopeptide (TPR) repeat protein